MFKLGRGGGGRGGGKRPLPPSLPSRPATAPGVARPPLGGGGRGRPGSAPGGGGAPPGREESFSLSSSAELNFGAIIRLTPDLIEEIKRVESQGDSARIKFAPNFTIPQGNIIDVGGKEFGFTWSRDELCDIYEERQSGEDGDGLLVECGSAWRKLNVLRTLDESTKKHVKKRSEEAERLHKSRKAIVLDPSNPSMKNQVKKMAAAGVEGNMRRMGWKQKKEPFFKKQKVETNQVSSVGPPKLVYKSGKSGNSSNINSKGVPSVSPIPSPSEQPPPVAAVSPFATAFSSREDANLEEITPLDINKEHIDIGNFEKEMPSRSAHGTKEKLSRQKGRIADEPVDLQYSQAQRASENSKGTNLKALEKAAGETTTNPMKKNASKIKNIEAPGKHMKSGVEVESSKRRESESGSSPESAHGIALAVESIFEEKFTDGNLEHQAQPSSKVVDPFENIDIMQDNPDPFRSSDKKLSNDNEGKTSSSDSGSDSDSESDSIDSGSDSGSQSRSRSKSRSPAGSASASSSDSDSDDSSSSKEGSDIDVDIMGDDEKGEVEPKAQAADLKLCSSPRIRASDYEQEQIDIIGDQEEQVASLTIDLNCRRDAEMKTAGEGTNFFPNNNSVKISENPDIKPGPNVVSNSYRANSRFPEVPFSLDQHKHVDDPQLQVSKSTINVNERAIKKTVGEKQNILNDWSHEQIETTKKMKSKREKPDYFKEKPEGAKKSRGAREAEVMPYGKSKDAILSVNSRYISPEKARQDQYKSNNNEWGGMKDIDPQECSVAERSRSVAVGNMRKIHQSPEFWSSSSVEAEQPGSRTGVASARRKSIDRFNNNIERIPVHPDSMMKDRMYKDTQDERSIGEKFSSLSEYNRKSGDHGAHWKDNEPSSQIRKSGGNISPVIIGRGNILRREFSELELGELREPAADETGGIKRQSEGKDSVKALENNAASTDSSNVDVNKGRSSSYLLPESKRQSPHTMRGGVHGNQEGFYRKIPPDDPVDNARMLQRTIPSQGQQPSIVDHADFEVKSHMDKSTELTRRGEIGPNQGTSLENHAGFLKKNSSILPPQYDIKHGGQKGYKNAKEAKQQKPNTLGDSTDRSNVSVETETNGRKRRESSTEDDSSFYSKYDKEIPELRDPIKNFSQYGDYVQEFRDKYDCYISLNKKLEKIRNDFLKVGEELELAKGRGSEEYCKVVDMLRGMYVQVGERNKQMKRVFMILHEELKTLKQRIQDFVEMHNT